MTVSKLFLLLVTTILSIGVALAAACQSCVAPLPFLSVRRHGGRSVRGLVLRRSSSTLPIFFGVVLSRRQLVATWAKSKPLYLSRQLAIPSLVVAGLWATHTCLKAASWLQMDDSTPQDDVKGDRDGAADEKQELESKNQEVSSALMIGTIKFYKSYISPLLPPACRFLPTCSQYGVQAIEEFGPTKGAILTAWRLLRCSPLGGRGYDPPRWPPVFYTFGSY